MHLLPSKVLTQKLQKGCVTVMACCQRFDNDTFRTTAGRNYCIQLLPPRFCRLRSIEFVSVFFFSCHLDNLIITILKQLNIPKNHESTTLSYSLKIEREKKKEKNSNRYADTIIFIIFNGSIHICTQNK